jgi:hypothetical protein
VIALTDLENKVPETGTEPELEKEAPTPVEGKVAFPKLGVVVIAVLLALIVILAIIIVLI